MHPGTGVPPGRSHHSLRVCCYLFKGRRAYRGVSRRPSSSPWSRTPWPGYAVLRPKGANAPFLASRRSNYSGASTQVHGKGVHGLPGPHAARQRQTARSLAGRRGNHRRCPLRVETSTVRGRMARAQAWGTGHGVVLRRRPLAAGDACARRNHSRPSAQEGGGRLASQRRHARCSGKKA